METKYYKRDWDETTGDILTDSWGTSIFYFEIDLSRNVLRQIHLFKNGHCLKYDTEYIEDKFGGLSEVPLDLEEFDEFQISKSEFEKVWNNFYYKKFPEIICTCDVLQGSPRLDGKRLSIGDIVSTLNINDDIGIVLTDFELTLQEVKQCLTYCMILQCKEDNPDKFCHNCTLRVLQDKSEFNEERDNWIIAKVLFEKYYG